MTVSVGLYLMNPTRTMGNVSLMEPTLRTTLLQPASAQSAPGIKFSFSRLSTVLRFKKKGAGVIGRRSI